MATAVPNTTGTKRSSIVLEDPLDRAQRYREPALVRKKPDEFGFLAINRGNLGISSFHIHEVPFGTLQKGNFSMA